MLGTLARTALAAVTCLALAGCNTANTPLTTDEETANLGPARCAPGTITGGGSALHRTAFEEALAAYAERCANRSSVGYNSMSADDALAAFGAERIQWIGADAPLDGTARSTAANQCGTNPLLTLPALANPIVLPYHLPGVERLVLTGPVAGRILDGTITDWNDPEIAALNPGVPLPAAPIVVVGQTDGSGATDALSRYLAAAGEWPEDRVGTAWAGTGEKKDRLELLQTVRATPNSIGYAELSAAQDNGLTMAWLDSGSGPVEPTVTSAARALADAQIAGTGDDLTLTPKLTGTGAGSYPLISVGYQVTCQSGLPDGKGLLLRDFLGFVVSEQQQQSLSELGLVPLPTSLTERVTETISEMT